MTTFVPIEALAAKMSDHAPPAWCKLAILGALGAHRIQLLASRGFVRAYLPPYYLYDEASQPGVLPMRLMRNNCHPSSVIEQYELGDLKLPNTEIVEVWQEHWTAHPKLIAPGWHMFVEPWDWDEPALEFEGFEIPRDYEMLFGYDDIHAEGEPDLALVYDAKFEGLCLSMDDAESLAPMLRLESLAFRSESNAPAKGIGRPKGSGFQSADEPLVAKMLQEIRADKSLNPSALAEKYVDEAAGHGTRQSKAKRLQRRLREFGY